MAQIQPAQAVIDAMLAIYFGSVEELRELCLAIGFSGGNSCLGDRRDEVSNWSW
jgi:hypothetical protein